VPLGFLAGPDSLEDESFGCSLGDGSADCERKSDVGICKGFPSTTTSNTSGAPASAASAKAEEPRETPSRKLFSCERASASTKNGASSNSAGDCDADPSENLLSEYEECSHKMTSVLLAMREGGGKLASMSSARSPPPGPHTYATRRGVAPSTAPDWPAMGPERLSVRMEMLGVVLEEVNEYALTDSAAIGQQAQLFAGRVLATLAGMSTLLEHIGELVSPSSSTSGVTPLMRP